MALVIVCDRCGSDNQKGLLTLGVGTFELHSQTVLKGSLSSYYRIVDLCEICIKELTQFLDGDLCIDGEDNPVHPHKKEDE